MTAWRSRCETHARRTNWKPSCATSARSRYHRLHPFHGCCTPANARKGQVQAWALNRYYYQAMIPIKDACLIARCDDRGLRREWRSRLVDHDGEREGDGGIARWLRLTDGLGLDREYVTSLRGLLPGTRFAVDAYVHFVREKTLLEAIASSLTELFSPVIIGERVEGMLKGLRFRHARDLAYFAKRPPQAKRDSDFALDYVKRNARTPDGAARGARGARIQVRRVVVDARCAASRLCGAGAHSARRVRAGGAGHDDRAPPESPKTRSRAAARRAADAQRGAGRLGAARARARVQGRRDRGRDPEALHRRGDLRRDRRRPCRRPSRRRASASRRTLRAFFAGLADKRLLEL